MITAPGGNREPDGDSICNVKLLGTAAWNKYCSIVLNELFVAVIMTRRQRLLSSIGLCCGTNATCKPFLSNANKLTQFDGNALLVKSSMKLVVSIPGADNDSPNGDCKLFRCDEIIDANMLLPLVLISVFVGDVRSRPPSRSSKSLVVVEWVLFTDFSDVGGMMSMGLSLSTSKSKSAFCEISQ